MKRIIFPFLTFLCLFALVPKSLTDIYLPQGSYCYIFCGDSEAENAIDLGNGYIVKCSSENYAATLKKCRDIEGVSVVFDAASYEVERVLNLFDAKIIFDLSQGKKSDLYCYSAKIKGGVYLEGKLINLQIFYSQGIIHVGTPLLLGSY